MLHFRKEVPGIAGYDWKSPLNTEKLMYLMLFLQLTTTELASKPRLLGNSLEHKIGPRVEFIYRSQVSLWIRLSQLLRLLAMLVVSLMLILLQGSMVPRVVHPWYMMQTSGGTGNVVGSF